MENTRPRVIVCRREFSFLIYCEIFKFLSKTSLQMQNRDHVFYLVLKAQLFSNNLNTNKTLMLFSLKASSNLLSDKLILACSVRRCQISLYFNFRWLELRLGFRKGTPPFIFTSTPSQVFSNVYLFIHLTF